MRARRGLRIGIATCGVLAAGVALGANGNTGVNIVVDPPGPVDIVDVAAGATQADTLQLHNVGTMAGNLAALVRDGACDVDVTAAPSPNDFPVSLPGSARHAVAVLCDATQTHGSNHNNPMLFGGSGNFGTARCEFHVTDGSNDTLTSFTVICATTGTSVLGESQQTIDFGDVPVDGTSTQQLVLTNTPAATIHDLSIQIGDQDGNFKIGSPCLQDLSGCDAAVTISPSAMFPLDVKCTPTTTGPLTAQMVVVADTGARIADVTLTCNGTSSGGSAAQITVDKTTVDVGSAEVSSGSASGTVHVSSTGGADLVISSISLVGGAAADWSFSATSPCTSPSMPCTLPTGTATDVTVTMDPSQLDARTTTLQIDSNDPLHGTTNIALTGTGSAGILVPDSTIGSGGINLGSVPVNGTSMFQFSLGNSGNEQLTGVTLAVAPATSYSLDMSTISIDPSSATTVMITCSPTAVQAFPATITVTAAGALSGSPISIPVTCTGVTGSMQATPNPIALGEIRTGAGPQTTMVTLSNVASTTLTLTSNPALGTPNAELAVGPPSGATITMAQPVTFNLTVDPTSDGDLTDTIAVAAGAQSMLQIPVTGSIVTAAVSAPASRQLGSFCVNQPTSSTTIGLTISGTASVTVDTPTFAGGDLSPFVFDAVSPSGYPSKLPKQSVATVAVTPKRQATAGEQTDTLQWSTDAPDPQPTTMVIAGFVSDGGAIAPGTLDYGSVPIHLPVPNDQIVTIQNCGTDTMTLNTPTITPTGAFHVDGAPVPTTLGPSMSTQVSVGFAPVQDGSFDAVLDVVSSKGDLKVDLHGVGIVDAGSGSGSGIGSGGDSNDDQKDFYSCATSGGDGRGALALVLAMIGAARGRRRRSRDA